MQIFVSIRSFNRFGGNTSYSLAGQYLSREVGTHGPAIAEVELLACFRGRRPCHASLESMIKKYHERFLPTLPRTKFYRKKRKLERTYETRVVDASFLEKYGFLDVSIFKKILEEIEEQLRALEPKLRGVRGFGFESFLADVASAVGRAPKTDAELRELAEAVEKEAEARAAAMDPWEKVGVEWDKYHSNARALLPDPFFWSEIEEGSPHGNDTGADLLANFRKWNKRNPARPVAEFAIELLKGWDLLLPEYETADEGEVRKVLDRGGHEFGVTNDAMVAAAFAAVKLRGWCDGRSRALALQAVARKRIEFETRSPRPEGLGQWLGELRLLEGALRGMPERV